MRVGAGDAHRTGTREFVPDFVTWRLRRVLQVRCQRRDTPFACSKNCPKSSARRCRVCAPAWTTSSSTLSACGKGWPPLRSPVWPLRTTRRCRGAIPLMAKGVSPPLQWTGLPAGAASLLLIVEDADSPTPNPLVHAIVVNLAADSGALAEAAIPSQGNEGAGLHVGRNSTLQAAWLPPDPPPGHGVHRYAFQLFALGSVPELSDTPRPRRNRRCLARTRYCQRTVDRHAREIRMARSRFRRV